MIISLSVLVLSLIPLLLVGRYAVPSADDFAYGYPAHLCWEDSHSILQTIHAATDKVILSYHTWQGTFSSIFLMALQPSVWSEHLYFLTPIIMLGVLIFSHFYLLFILLVKKLKISKPLWITLSCILCFLQVETVLSPVDSFYWFNGSVHYTFMHNIMLILIASILHHQCTSSTASKIILFVIGSLACILCGGANYATALCGFVLLVTVFFFSLILKNQWHFQIPLILIYAIAFGTSVIADGNTVRQAYFVDVKRGAIESIIYSFLYCGYYGIFSILWILWYTLDQCSHHSDLSACITHYHQSSQRDRIYLPAAVSFPALQHCNKLLHVHSRNLLSWFPRTGAFAKHREICISTTYVFE